MVKMRVHARQVSVAYRCNDHAVAWPDDSGGSNSCIPYNKINMSAVHKNEWYINEHADWYTGAELPEEHEHTNLLRIRDLFRWLGEVSNVGDADTPFKSWSPKMNCKKGMLSQYPGALTY
jgi:hypothetical protein